MPRPSYARVVPCDPLEELRLAVHRYGTQKALATAAGVSNTFISDVLRGKRHISTRLTDFLGLRVVYLRVTKP